jgi:flagellar biogenesis protein FliO
MDALRPALPVVFVLGLLFAAAWWIRRSSGGSAGVGFFRMARNTRTMHVLERLPLTPQHSLVLVSFPKEKLLLAVHPAGVTIVRSEPLDPPQSAHAEGIA